MIEYSFIDNNGNEIDLDTSAYSGLGRIVENTFVRLSDTFSTEVDIVEKSFTAGADFPGRKRDTSKELSFSYQVIAPTNDDYKNIVNSLIAIFRNTVYIRNKTDNIRARVEFKDHGIEFITGSELRLSDNTVNFIQLCPYWEDFVETEVTQAGVTTATNIVVTNNGKVDTPSIITMTSVNPSSIIDIYLYEHNDGIYINDLQFGSPGLETIILDNGEGTLKLGTIDRKNKIALGTGPFDLRPGTNTLVFNTNGEIDVSIKYRKRYYV